jgi:polyhydroxybutyrate depolymerase
MTGEVVVNNSDYRFTKWSACTNDVTIEAYLTQDGGHAWPGGLQSGNWGDVPSTAINVNDLIWNFFQRFQLP